VRNVSESTVEKINTHILFSVPFPRKSCRLWDNVEKYWRTGQVTDDIMAHAHCIRDTSGHGHILRMCNIYRFSSATMVVQTHHNVTSYFACLVYLKKIVTKPSLLVKTLLLFRLKLV